MLECFPVDWGVSCTRRVRMAMVFFRFTEPSSNKPWQALGAKRLIVGCVKDVMKLNGAPSRCGALLTADCALLMVLQPAALPGCYKSLAGYFFGSRGKQSTGGHRHRGHRRRLILSVAFSMPLSLPHFLSSYSGGGHTGWLWWRAH